MFKNSQSGFADLDQWSLNDVSMQLSSQYSNCVSTESDDGYYSNSNSKHYRFMFLRLSLSGSSQQSNDPSENFGPNLEYQMNDAFKAVGYLSSKLSNKFTISKENIDDCNLEEFLTDICLSTDDPSSIENREGCTSPQMTFYSSQPSQLNYEYIFVVGSFSYNRFQYLQRYRLKIVSPLAILYWCSLFDRCPQQFNFLDRIHKANSNGLFSECMDKNVVYISNIFPNHILQQMMEQICWMGGNISSDLNLMVTHAVGDKELNCLKGDHNIYAAHFLQIPIVGKEWISTSWNQLQLQTLFSSSQDIVDLKLILRYHDLEPKKIFKNLTIGIVESVYDDLDKISGTINRISECVLRFGGLFVNSHANLRYSSMNVVLHLSDNLELAELYRKDDNFVSLNDHKTKSIPILKLQWFFDTIINQSVQAYEPYIIPVQLGCTNSFISHHRHSRDMPTSPYGHAQSRLTIKSTSTDSKSLLSDEIGWIDQKANQ